MKLNIYLSFHGNCEEAFGFYQSVLGGEITMMQHFADSPMADNVGEEWYGKVMHASLQAGGIDLMGSDGMPGQFVTPQGYHVSAQFEEPEGAERVFAALAEGGEIRMPLEQSFWARRFGMLTDRFGINWMVNCN
jgi:PhnB protein